MKDPGGGLFLGCRTLSTGWYTIAYPAAMLVQHNDTL